MTKQLVYSGGCRGGWEELAHRAPWELRWNP